MTRPRILVTRKLPDAVEQRAVSSYDACLNPDDTPIPVDQLPVRAQGMDGILCTITDRLTAEAIAALPESVRILATFSVGYDHVDLAAAKAKGIQVTNTPGVVTEATADIAMLLMLGAARRAWEGESLLRSRNWTGWAPAQLLGMSLGSKKLGIVGMGRVGQAVSRRARAFGMEIHYTSRRRRTDLPPDLDARFHANPSDLLPLCDVLSLHLAAMLETRHWLNAERIGLLPRGAIVVNTARGDVVDDDALIAALQTGHLAAAGLDVFAGEPAIDPRYAEVENAMLLPHLGTATVETRCAMGFKALDNLDAYFAGVEPPDRIA